MRMLQEWLGHRDFTTTLIYADFAPDPAGGAAFPVDAADSDSDGTLSSDHDRQGTFASSSR
jgi:hypothetical protein